MRCSPTRRECGLLLFVLFVLAGCTPSSNPLDAVETGSEEPLQPLDTRAFERAAAAKADRPALPLGKSGRTDVYTFDDLPMACVWNREFPETYHDLGFSGSRFLASCAMDDDLGLVPVNSQEQNNQTQTHIKLPRPASEVAISYFGIRFHHRARVFVAYDEVGNEVDRVSLPSDGTWRWLTLSGRIHEVAIVDYQSQTVWDDLTVTDASVNAPPVAVAGDDQIVIASEEVTLDGSASSDDDGDALAYYWTWVSKPAGSAADFTSSVSEITSFVTDRSGLYRVRLVANDGSIDSAPDEIEIQALSTSESFAHLKSEVYGLQLEGALNGGQANSLQKMLDSAMKRVDRRPKAAINQLRAFTRHVEALVSEGVLDVAQGDGLQDFAARLAAVVESPAAAG